MVGQPDLCVIRIGREEKSWTAAVGGGGIDRRGERLVGCDRENSQSFERSEIPAMLNKGR